MNRKSFTICAAFFFFILAPISLVVTAPYEFISTFVENLQADKPSEPIVFIMGLEGCPDCEAATEDTREAIESLMGYAEHGELSVAVIEETADDGYYPKITEFYGTAYVPNNDIPKLTDKSKTRYEKYRESYLDSMFVIEQYAGFEWYPSIIFYNGKDDITVIEWRNPEEGYKDLDSVISEYVEE